MIQFLRPLLSTLVGLALLGYGLLHVVTHYPGATVFTALWASLPALVFMLGVTALIAGLVLLVLGIKGIRQRYREIDRAYSGRRRYSSYGDADADDVEYG